MADDPVDKFLAEQKTLEAHRHELIKEVLRQKEAAIKAFDDKVVPAMQAKMAQAQGQFEQQKAEQAAIAARYPELRGCMKDQVVFLDGGTKTVPVSEIKMPVTMAQADNVVARLR